MTFLGHVNAPVSLQKVTEQSWNFTSGPRREPCSHFCLAPSAFLSFRLLRDRSRCEQNYKGYEFCSWITGPGHVTTLTSSWPQGWNHATLPPNMFLFVFFPFFPRQAHSYCSNNKTHCFPSLFKSFVHLDFSFHHQQEVWSWGGQQRAEGLSDGTVVFLEASNARGC